MRKPLFAYAKTKTRISFAVTAKLISAFVFATWIVQYLYFLNPSLWPYLVIAQPVRNPEDKFSRVAAHMFLVPIKNLCFRSYIEIWRQP